MSSGPLRTTSSRRHNRNNNASPYSRPSSKKSAGWSIGGLLKYINPFASRPEEEYAPPEGEAASRLAARGEQLHPGAAISGGIAGEQPRAESQHQPQPPPPPVPTTSQSPPESSMNDDRRTSPRSDDSHNSSTENYKKVQQFLAGKAGQPLNHVELAGLVHLLQNSVEDEDDQPEPFRFSKSPSTPVRGNTPTVNFCSPSTSEQMVANAGTAAQGGRKTLAKNPMGVYRWQGGGSARPRNRYQSPSFGSTPVRSTIKLVPEKPRTDNKRRRVGHDATSSSPQRTGVMASKVNGSGTSILPTSNSAPAALNGQSSNNGTIANGRNNGASATVTPATPRIRTAGIKPTTPAVPSPLRQTWGQSDSPPHTSPSQTASKPTRAASFMTELIKEVTPPKKPEFANPYEAANPMIKPAPKKQPVRRTRAAAKANVQSQKPAPELTPQAIIEATLPKGSKRSRPPPELIGVRPSEVRVTSPPESSAPRRSNRLNGTDPKKNGNPGSGRTAHGTVEDLPDEEQPSPPKKQRTVRSPPVVARQAVTVEEIQDVDMSTGHFSRPVPTAAYTPPSEVVEPVGEKPEKKRSTSPTSSPMFANLGHGRPGISTAKSSAPKAPSKLRFSIQADKDEKTDNTASTASAAVPAPTPARAAPAPALAPSVLSAPTPSTSIHVSAVTRTPAMPTDARAFVSAMREDQLPTFAFVIPMSTPGAGPSTLKARQSAKFAPVSSLPVYDFSKAPVPVPAPTATVYGGFNWAAAGMKPPSKPADGSWACSVCMISNLVSTDKCVACDATRVDKSKSVVQGFDWAAAGMKPPSKPPGGQWKCSVCQLSNPMDAEQCTVCESPR